MMRYAVFNFKFVQFTIFRGAAAGVEEDGGMKSMTILQFQSYTGSKSCIVTLKLLIFQPKPDRPRTKILV